MQRKSKIITMLCSLIFSVAFMLFVLLIITYNDLMSRGTANLVFTSESLSTQYNGKPLQSEKWTMTEGKLKDGHSADVIVSGEQTNVGSSENYIHVSIVDEFGADVSNEYNIETRPGTLTVRPKKFTLMSATGEKVYDGEPLSDSSYSIQPEGAIAQGEQLHVSISGDITEIGTVPNSIEWYSITDKYGYDKSFNYDITVISGTLTVKDPNDPDGNGGGGGEVGDSLSGNGSSLGAPEDLDDSFNTTFYTLYSNKTEVLYLRHESFGDYTKKGWTAGPTYGYQMNSGASAAYLTSSSLANYGYSPTTILITPVFTNMKVLPYYTVIATDPSDLQKSDSVFTNDAIDAYRVDYYSWDGYSTISLPEHNEAFELQYRDYVYSTYLTLDSETYYYVTEVMRANGITSDSATVIDDIASYIQSAAVYNLEYDRALDGSDNIIISFLRDYGEGICQHYASSAVAFYRALGIPARYTTGFMAYSSAGETVDVTGKTAHAWVEVYLDGIGWMMVEVTGSSDGSGDSPSGGDGEGGDKPNGPKVTVTPYAVEKKYDGTPLYASTKLRFKNLIENSYFIDYGVEGERTEPGVSQSIISYLTITEKVSGDVVYDSTQGIDKLNVEIKPGTIHVYIEELKFKTETKTKIYDGTSLNTEDADLEIVSCNLVEGHTFVAQPEGSAKYVFDNSDNAFSITVYDEFGENVTNLYKLRLDWGDIKIEPKPLNVSAQNAEKIYDGTELTAPDIIYDPMELASGDYISSYTVIGTITNVGRAENLLEDITISNSEGEDVTLNYKLEITNGILKITFR